HAYGSDVELSGGTLRVTATGRTTRIALGTDERTIELSQITALSFSKGNMLTNGALELVDERGKTKNHFRRKSNEEMQAMFDAISQRVPRGAVGASTKGASLISEDKDAFQAKAEAWIEEHVKRAPAATEREEGAQGDAPLAGPEPSQPPAHSGSIALAEEIRQLEALHAQGVLDDVEFKQAKSRLLNP